MTKVFPFVDWLFNYRREWLKNDVTAGLTVAVMLVPQGMAYAMLAGLPPIVGLYASVVPLFIYALFGSSRQLAVGPVAMVSLLVASALGAVAEPGSGEYLVLAAVLAGMVGLIQFLMGATRLGFLVNFLSHPVISGFTSAAALIIGFNQLKHLLGVSIPRSHHVFSIIIDAIQRLNEINQSTFVIGIAGIAALFLFKRWKPVFPAALVVVVFATVLVKIFNLEAVGVKIVGAVPKGLPALAIPSFDAEAITSLWPTAIAISLIAFLESIAVAKAFAAKNHSEVDANQELIGLGLANVAASLFGAYPVTGGFSRTAVNAQAGARSGLASIITAATVALALLFLTPFFYYLPQAVLAAIIMVAVFGLVDVKEVRHLYKVKRSDLLLLILAFAATLFLGIERGILISVIASLVLMIKRTSKPHSAELGRLPGATIYRNLERYPEAAKFKGLGILRVDASLYFANVEHLKDRLQKLERSNKPLQAVIFDASSVNDIDSTADAVLHALARDYKARGIEFYFANVKGPVRDVMKRSGFYQRLGADHFFFNVHDAVQCFLGRKEGIRFESPRGISKKEILINQINGD